MFEIIINETNLDRPTLAKGVLAALKLIGGNIIRNMELAEIHIFNDLESGEALEGYTYADGDSICVVCTENATPVTLAHELVHVAQLLSGLPLCELQAYNFETTVAKEIYQ